MQEYFTYLSSAGRKPTLDSPEDEILSVEDPDNVTTSIGTSVTVLESSVVTLNCNADGHPFPTITWSRNWKPLAGDHNIVMDEDMQSVTIRNVKPDDEGEYSCSATNVLGRETRNSTLSVIGKFYLLL